MGHHAGADIKSGYSTRVTSTLGCWAISPSLDGYFHFSWLYTWRWNARSDRFLSNSWGCRCCEKDFRLSLWWFACGPHSILFRDGEEGHLKLPLTLYSLPTPEISPMGTVPLTKRKQVQEGCASVMPFPVCALSTGSSQCTDKWPLGYSSPAHIWWGTQLTLETSPPVPLRLLCHKHHI